MEEARTGMLVILLLASAGCSGLVYDEAISSNRLDMPAATRLTRVASYVVVQAHQ